MVLPTVAEALPAVGSVVGQVGGGIVESVLGSKAADKAWKRQKKVLQNEIQWKTQDAIAAGLHPLAALGVNPASGPAAAEIGNFGDLGASQAANAIIQSREERSATQAALDSLNLSNMGLQNDLLRAQIGSIKARTVGAAGRTPEGTTRIGNIDVSDPHFGDKVNSAWDDWVSGPAGALKSLSDWWNTSWKRLPFDNRAVGGAGSLKLPPAASVKIMDLPVGGGL